MSAHPDVASLATGIAVMVLGGLLLLDQSGELELSLGLVGAMLAAVVGVALLLAGLTDAEPSRSSPPPGPMGVDER
jgi:hypothetical protein